jgi:hypothetical protein
MSGDPQNLVLEQLRFIREEIAVVRAEQSVMSLKIGTLAESQVSTNRRIDALSGRIDVLSSEIQNMRTDVRTISMAVDQHTARLDRVETMLSHSTITH